MLDRHEWRIIEDVATATDRLLAGESGAVYVHTSCTPHTSEGMYLAYGCLAIANSCTQWRRLRYVRSRTPVRPCGLELLFQHMHCGRWPRCTVAFHLSQCLLAVACCCFFVRRCSAASCTFSLLSTLAVLPHQNAGCPYAVVRQPFSRSCCRMHLCVQRNRLVCLTVPCDFGRPRQLFAVDLMLRWTA